MKIKTLDGKEVFALLHKPRFLLFHLNNRVRLAVIELRETYSLS